MLENNNKHLNDLKLKFESYVPISQETWKEIEDIVVLESVRKGEIILANGQIAKDLYFVCKDVLRTFITDQEGTIYNKNLFLEGDFAGSKASLLQQMPSEFAIEALEDAILFRINYKKYRDLIAQYSDFKNFYIAYLEKNWIIEKEQREIALVMKNATQRYLDLLSQHPDISKRISLQHIASHLGITPTQLSRIRKNLEKE